MCSAVRLRIVTVGTGHPNGDKWCLAPGYSSFYDIATISDYHVRQLLLTDENARLSNELIVNQIVPQKIPAEVRVNVSLNGTTVTEVKQQVTLQPGINHITLPAEVTNLYDGCQMVGELRLCMISRLR